MNYKVLIAAVLLGTVAQADELEPRPPGWGVMGNGGPQALPGACQLGVDGDMRRAGQPNMSIKCDNDIPSFGGLTQTFEAAAFYGKRVRFSAWLMADGILDIDGIEGEGGLFITVPSPEGALMNRMPERTLKEWTSWEHREFVVDIPEHGPWIVIGFWMQGQGQIWIRDIEFEVVPESVPVNLSWETDETPGPSLQLE